LGVEVDNSISFLKGKRTRRIIILNLVTFIALNLLNILYSIIISYDLNLGINFYLPGTGIEFSGPLQISIISLFILGISPVLTSFLLFLIYKDINNLTLDNLNQTLKDIPENIKQQIIKNLKNLNKKFKDTLSME
ncbi:MAG: hypothetical protein ACFFGP_03430, partial [Promethearchaeota archaeon]